MFQCLFFNPFSFTSNISVNITASVTVNISVNITANITATFTAHIAATITANIFANITADIFPSITAGNNCNLCKPMRRIVRLICQIIRELCDIRDVRQIACDIISKTEVCSLLDIICTE